MDIQLYNSIFVYIVSFHTSEKKIGICRILAVIANQSADWCGNPPVERNQVTIPTNNRGNPHFLVLFGTFPH